ncbi:MAG: T9SS type A sorting domain-containing protein [Bacteroidetes bacterium]|nr:T9SS type A sorting domain-containing protein [Bacteroidota bacterium]
MRKLFTILVLLMSVDAIAQPCIPNSNSLIFNGTTSYVSMNSQNNLNMTTAVTVEAWVYATQFAASSASGSIFCKHGWSSGESGYVLRAGGNTTGNMGILSFNLAGDSAGVPTSWKHVESPSGSLTLNTWYHVAGTFDGSNLKIYINGNLAGTLAFTGTIIPSIFNPKISRLSDNAQAASRYWNGYIDEVRVFNRTLSQTEIADSMGVQIVASAQTGLVGYWRLNEGTGTAVSDLSASANSGTTTSTTWTTQVPFNTVPPTPTIGYSPGLLTASASANYQWYRNGILIGGATQQTLPLTQTGSYTVAVTVNGCTATSSPYVVTSLSVQENIFDHSISIAPNPAHDFMFIHLENISSVSHLEVVDVTGRIVFRANDFTSGDVQVPVTDFSKGIYFARFYGKDVVLTKKIVVD